MKVGMKHLQVLERKAKLFPLKKRKIYKEAVDIVTLVERENEKADPF